MGILINKKQTTDKTAHLNRLKNKWTESEQVSNWARTFIGPTTAINQSNNNNHNKHIEQQPTIETVTANSGNK